jgi:hypothetical protein
MRVLVIALSCLCFAAACGDEETPDAGGADAGLADSGTADSGTTDSGQNEVPARYTYESRFGAGSSVSYTGQTFRHVLIAELKGRIGGLTARIDQGTLTPTTGSVLAELNFYVDFDPSTGGDVDSAVAAGFTSPPATQSTFGDFGSTAKLRDKIAGNDAVGQHQDWNTTGIVGWSGAGPVTPTGLVTRFFERIEEQAIARANGTIPNDPTGTPIAQVYVTPEGQDLRELTQKFLDGAIGYSQGTDDYLDDDLAGKGINSDNTAPESGRSYTALEHAWDEGFGYFGATPDYGDYTDEELAAAGGRADYAKAYHDTNGDGMLNLLTEVNWGHSLNAAKRDKDSVTATDFTADAFLGFRAGRHLISSADGALSPAQVTALKSERDRAIQAWEKAIAATVVHYINDLLKDHAKFSTPDYKFLDHAKHWSELKGFALALQFNPKKLITTAQLTDLHARLGEAPALPGSPNVAAYRTGLLEAKVILKNAYNFSDANLGDDQGEGGW